VSQNWAVSTGGIIFSSPTIDSSGNLFVGSNNNQVHAISSADGSTNWTFTTGNWVDTTPALSHDESIVYFGSWDNKLYAVHVETGAETWSFETNSFIQSSPAVGLDGKIYFGSMDSIFYALEANGSVAWEYFAGQPIFSSPAIGPDGTLYFGDENGTLHAVNPDGSEKWTYLVDEVADTNKSILSSPAMDGEGNLYFGSGNGYCYSISDDGNQATLNWKYLTGDRVDSSPALGTNDEVFFVSRDGYMRSLPLFSAATENLANWEVLVGDVFYSSPVVDENGRVYLIAYTGGGENHLFAYDANGTKAWDSNVSNPPFTIPSVVDSSLLLSDAGDLYFGCFDQNLYSLSLGLAPANSGWPMFRRNSTRNGDWPSFSLTLQSSPTAGGSTTGQGQFYEGSLTTITSTPNTGYSFSEWTGDGVTDPNALSTAVVMTSARNITASFSLNSYSLFVHAGTGGDINGSGTFTHGSSPIISAIPNSEYTFAGWTGEGVNDPSASTTTVSMTETRSVSASFTLRKEDFFLLKLSTNPSTAGIVRINSAGYEEFPKDSIISISAIPSEGYSFERWSGEGIAEPNSQDTTVWMTKDKNITAIFSLNSYLLSLSSNTRGSLTYSGSLLHGSYATIIATPNSGYSFLSWDGEGVLDLFSSTSQVFMDQDRNISASFTVSISSGLEPSSLGASWYSSWLGVFYQSAGQWIYHIHLGWIFLAFTESNLWLWNEYHGWMWTSKTLFEDRFLWSNNLDGWVYLDTLSSSGAQIWNYKTNLWSNW
jgi:outer membrane protein assembly factor BamB